MDPATLALAFTVLSLALALVAVTLLLTVWKR